MRKKALIILIIILGLLQNSPILYSQNIKKLKNKASNLFDNKEYNKAIPLFLQLDSIEPNNFETKYKLGASYLNTKYEKTKAIPYLQFALKNSKNIIPATVYKDLGSLYHLDYKFDKAIEYFNKYKKLSDNDDKFIGYVDTMINICNYAKQQFNDSLKINILPLKIINTNLSEENPFVAADNSVIYFTREDINKNKKIFFSERIDSIWEAPKELKFEKAYSDKPKNIAGISADGQQIFLSILNKDNYDIYIGNIDNGYCKNIIRLSNSINSKYNEYHCSLSVDGTKMFFSSDRVGGFGGKDIYFVNIDSLGNISAPINLGNDINTSKDEDSPFFHPDEKTLYFSSNGHKTIGGFDIYSSSYENEIWSDPVNLGYPINTTYDDFNYILNADKSIGYVTSNKQKKYKDYDIYKVIINKSIPLTLVKGLILAGNPAVPIKSKIRIIDKETNQKIKYIYNPNSKTGKYLMIFPPNKNYSMIITAEGYIPYQIDIKIPNQTYFYELYQEIILSPIKLDKNGKIIGQEISIKNKFYDINSKLQIDTSRTDTIYKKDYTKLIKLINKLIVTTDTLSLERIDNESKRINNSFDNNKIREKHIKKFNELINSISDAIINTDTNALNLINSKTLYDDETIGRYYFSEDSNSIGMNIVIIGDDTIKTLPPIKTYKNKFKINYNNLIDSSAISFDSINENKNYIVMRLVPENKRKYIITKSIFYNTGEYELPVKYKSLIKDFSNLLINNSELGIEINSYTDAVGDSKSNLILSNKRAITILKLFIENGISTKNLVVNFYGESKSQNELTEKDKSKNRRTDLRIFEIKKQ